MRTFDVQGIELDVPFADAFRYLANPMTLPEWTHAFKTADDHHATMSTPQGIVQVDLRVDASEAHGTIDWTMTFPNGVVAQAHSRVTPHRGPQRQDSCRSLARLNSGARRQRFGDETVLPGI